MVLLKHPLKLKNKLKNTYYKYTFEIQEAPVELVGQNWNDDDIKRVAVLVGFNPWKRELLESYLPHHKLMFLQGNITVDKLYIFYNSCLKNNKSHFDFYIWGKKDTKVLKIFFDYLQYIEFRNFQTLYVEDGFLRSVGMGLLHSRPLSLNFDSSNHFENKENHFEQLLGNYKLRTDEIEKAKIYLQLFKDLRLTKYYNSNPFDSKFQLSKEAGVKNVLVIGQVEDDASVIFSTGKIKTNLELIERAKKDNPNAKIYFRPHPDYFFQTRKDSSSTKISKIVNIITPDVPWYSVLSFIDEVYVISSLSGIEAIFHGKTVHVFGTPFYSNWGLTNDHVKIERRSRQLSVEELFYITYVIYPHYMHPYSDEKSNFLEIASHMVLESLKDRYYLSLKKNQLYKAFQPYLDILTTPCRVLNYIVGTGNFSNANSKDLECVLDGDYALKNYPYISSILINSSNYEQLVNYTNKCLATIPSLLNEGVVNFTLFNEFLYYLNIAQRNSNGRVVDDIPDMLALLEKYTNHKYFMDLFKSYIEVLSNNLHYDMLENVLLWLNNHDKKDGLYTSKKKGVSEKILEKTRFDVKASHYYYYANILSKKPSRSNRNPDYRNRLRIQAANLYLTKMNNKSKKHLDTYVNQVLYHMLLKQPTDFSKSVGAFLDLYKKVVKKNANMARKFQTQRVSDILTIASNLLKMGMIANSKQIYNILTLSQKEYGKHYVTYSVLTLNILKKEGKYSEIFNFYNKIPTDIQSDEKVQQIISRAYREMGLFDSSQDTLQSMVKNAKTVARRIALENEVDKIDFCKQTSTILGYVPQPLVPKGVVFLASQTCLNTLAMLAPALIELKKMGYAVVNLTQGMTLHQRIGIDYIDNLAGAIPLDLVPVSQKYDWHIDWDNCIVEAQGINFYQGFYERLSTYARRFFVDINRDVIIQEQFFNQLKRADLCLDVAHRIFDNVVKNGIPSIIITGNSHVTPFSIFRDFARAKNHPLLSFVNCNVAYESYFSNLGSKFANTMCVTDMTLYPNIRAPFMARQDQFDAWYKNNQNNPIFLEKADKLLNLNRVGSESNESEQKIVEMIKQHKMQGKKIICAFGKVPVDLNVPYDGGHAHQNMSDWITHTVDICNKLPKNVLLLIKPHPHELRPEIALDLVEGFRDLICTDLGDNVVFLGHKDINGGTLAPLLDLALLYNGSSGVEMTAQGIPVMMTSYFGEYDYPIQLLYPQSRKDYESFISSLDYPIPIPEIRKKAAFLLCYLGTEEISILNQYSIRQLTNDKVGPPKWKMDKINDFLKNGDPKMTLAAERITEKSRLLLNTEKHLE